MKKETKTELRSSQEEIKEEVLSLLQSKHGVDVERICDFEFKEDHININSGFGFSEEEIDSLEDKFKMTGIQPRRDGTVTISIRKED